MPFCNTCRLQLVKARVLDLLQRVGPATLRQLGGPKSDVLAALYDLEQEKRIAHMGVPRIWFVLSTKEQQNGTGIRQCRI